MTELKKSFSNLISTKIFLVAFTFASFNSLANTLDKDEHLGYARACFKAVNEKSTCKAKMSYWPSRILQIDSSGAEIETKIEVVSECETDSKKGWAKPEVFTTTSTFTCITANVPKGEFPKPDAYLSSTENNNRQIWVYQRWTPKRNEFIGITLKETEDYRAIASKEDFKNFKESIFEYDDLWNKRAGIHITEKYFLRNLK